MNWHTQWEFKTAQFTVRAQITEDHDLDLSWDDDGETTAGLADGSLVAFGTRVQVIASDGREIGSDSLWGSIYKRADDFFSGHRDRDPMNRNCSIMRAARGDNVVICHYFPDMVRQA